jgi:hypothetical protein
MISEQGAILIATVLPVALLVVLVEARPAFRAFLPKWPKWAKYIGGFVLAVVFGQVLWAEWLCITSVASGKSLEGFEAVSVSVAAYSLGVLTWLALTGLIANLFFEDI